MKEMISIFLIAVALSMDTFSLSLGLGTYNISRRKIIQMSIIVGIFHFLMPFLGNIIGNKIVSFFTLNSNLFLGCILLFIAINLLIDMLRKDYPEEVDFSIYGILLFAFGVSIDAFSTGLGLSAVTSSKIIAMLIFAIVSTFFTYIGLVIGKFASEKLGNKATIFGLILLIILGISHICK